MTERQFKVGKANLETLRRWRGELERMIHEIELNGYASGSIGSAGGSKSYTRIDLNTLSARSAEYSRRISALEKMLGGNPSTIGQIQFVRG